MSIKKRAGPVRQLSLPQNSQRNLQKQSSVDLYDRKTDKDTNNNTIRKNNASSTPSREPDISLLISASSIAKQNGANLPAPKKSRSKERSAGVRGKGRGTWAPPPRPIRLAWGERGQSQNQSQDGSAVQVVAERCKGQSRPQTAGATSRENALVGYNRNTILYSRKQFAERIRQAWREREITKPNLEIFLASPANLEGMNETRVPCGAPRTTYNYDYNTFSVGNASPTGHVPARNGTSEKEPVCRNPHGCSSPYSVLSSELGSELTRASELKGSSAESEPDAGVPWESEFERNFRNLINHSTSSDDEDDAPISFPKKYTAGYTNEQVSSRTQSPAVYKIEQVPRSGAETPSVAESSSFESSDGARTWGNAEDGAQQWDSPQEQIPASTRRQNFRNASQKAIDKSSVTAPPTPSTPSTPTPQPQKVVRKPIQAPPTPSSARAMKPTPVAKRLWSVPSQSFDLPSSEPNSYRGYERNIKSAPPPKRRLKAVRRKLKPFYGNLSASDDDSPAGKGTVGRRRFSNGPKEVETMISLLSPTDSETEPDNADPMALLHATEVLPLSPSTASHVPPPPFGHSISESSVAKNVEPKSSREEIREIKPPPMLFLRKSPKPVSFKLVGANIRSHSALYPCRRGELSIFENGSRDNSMLHPLKVELPGVRLELTETRLDSKRAVHMKTTDAPSELDEEEKENEKGNNGKDSQRLHSILIQKISDDEKKAELSNGSKLQLTSPLPAPNTQPSTDPEENGATEPKFKTTKERECWDLFRKMVDKGVSVSFDTVLRGMLTPTEYRLRKASEDSTH